MGLVIEFFVPGTPAPGGSKKAFYNPKAARAFITDDSKRSRPWKALVSDFALQAMAGRVPLNGPLAVLMVFVLPRLKGHFGTGKNATRLKDSAPKWHTTKPDATKLLRSTEDACTGILWRDDAQIAQQEARKRYGDTPGAWILVREICP